MIRVHFSTAKPQRGSLLFTALVACMGSIFSPAMAQTPKKQTGGGGASSNLNLVLSGTLRFQRGDSIVDYNLQTKRIAAVAEGRALYLNVRGDMLYYDKSGALIISNTQGKRLGSLRMPGEKPALSPDGKYIMLIEKRVDPVQVLEPQSKHVGVKLDHVVVRDRATGAEISVFTFKSNGNWTPDGRLLISEWTGYERGPGYGLNVTDREFVGLTPVSMDKQVSDMAASPDGTKVVIVSRGRLWTMNADGRNVKPIAATGRTQTLPAWSPDGKWIAFFEKTNARHSDVRAVRLSDNMIVTLRTSTGAALHPQVRMFWRP